MVARRGPRRPRGEAPLRTRSREGTLAHPCPRGAGRPLAALGRAAAALECILPSRAGVAFERGPSFGASPTSSPVAQFAGGRGHKDVGQAGPPWPFLEAPPLPSVAFSLRGGTLPWGRRPGRVPLAVLRRVAHALARHSICGRAWPQGRRPSRAPLAVLGRATAALGRLLIRGRTLPQGRRPSRVPLAVLGRAAPALGRRHPREWACP